MSELATLARPYAVALYKRAKQTATTEKWSQTLAFLTLVLQDQRIAKAAANPKGKKESFIQALLDLSADKLDDEAQNFVRLLVQNRRLNLIQSISEQFELSKAEDEGYIEVKVRSAYALGQDEMDSLNNLLQSILKKTPRLKVEIDENLIGGVLIQAGDRVIDASIRGQIQRLAKRLYN